jgi:hypothetical protein
MAGGRCIWADGVLAFHSRVARSANFFLLYRMLCACCKMHEQHQRWRTVHAATVGSPHAAQMSLNGMQDVILLQDGLSAIITSGIVACHKAQPGLLRRNQ